MDAQIYDAETGDLICRGLQGCDVCDEAINTARELAVDLDKDVLLCDDDGEWIISPDGSCTPYDE